MIPVVLSGGVGSRLWPMSRGMYPKQLLPLVSENETMLQQTVMRVSNATDIENLVIVCNQEHRFMVGEQLGQIGISKPSVILEPEGKNTAPALALAAFHVLKNHGDQVMLVMPADHVIENTELFCKAVDLAKESASQGNLVTFGVEPTNPEIGYGYIKAGRQLGPDVYKIDEFKEKPNQEIAESYVKSGIYYWNSGIFAFKVSTYLNELKNFSPEIYEACNSSYKGSIEDLDFIRIDEEKFKKSPSESIDIAVLERTVKSAVIPINVGWNDIGSWSALWETLQKDDEGNVVQGDVLVHNTSNSLIHSRNKLVTTIGVKDLIVVLTDDALLVADKNEVQNVKEIVSRLTKENRSHVHHHRKVYRPWGWYDSIDHGERFQVKRILVKPGARLSVQMHRHRAEHWVVVSGTAEVLNGDSTVLLRENESTYIPIGVKHSLKNPSKVKPLEIIEIQSGSYLGEDDIVRFEDQYGRA